MSVKKAQLLSLIALVVLASWGMANAGIYNPPSPGGSSSGGLTAANNLSDLAASSTARTNLGLTRKQPVQWTIESPTSTSADISFIALETSTISDLLVVNKTNGDTVAFNWAICSSAAAATSTCGHLFAIDSTSTASTTPNVYPARAAFASTTIPAGWMLRPYFSSPASSSQFTQTLYYTTP